MTFELLFGSGRDNQIGHLRRKETSQSPHALDFADLVGDAPFELLVQLVELIEQPCILDGDHGLRCEILHQLDLLVGEWTDLLAVDHDRRRLVPRP